jgi:hypothetical protein
MIGVNNNGDNSTLVVRQAIVFYSSNSGFSSFGAAGFFDLSLEPSILF